MIPFGIFAVKADYGGDSGKKKKTDTMIKGRQTCPVRLSSSAQL